MKYLIIIAAVAIVFTGCIKSTSKQTDTMTAIINGKTFIANSVIASLDNGSLTLDGSNAAGQRIEIVMDSVTTTKMTYTLDSSFEHGYYEATSGLTGVFSTTGTLTVNIHTGSIISGTFSFTCKDGTVIASGVYNSSY